MKYAFLLKRFEIWLLFGIVVALLIFAFQPVEEPVSGELGSGEGQIALGNVADDPEPGTEEESSEGIVVKNVAVETAGEGQIVEVTFLASAKAEDPVPVNETTLRASTSDGVQVPHFFSPFQKEQSVTPSEVSSMITVKLWLAETTDSIWLDFQGERAEAKLPGES